jgi:hypothetical protein
MSNNKKSRNGSGPSYGPGAMAASAPAPRTQGQSARHVCYCLTPTRYLWLFDQYRQREQIGGLKSAILQPLLSLLRRWDWAAAQQVACACRYQPRLPTPLSLLVA